MTLSPSSATRNSIENMDEKIERYSKLLDTVRDDDRSDLHSKLMSAKLMNQKLVATTALAKVQTILAEMDMLIAESNLTAAVDQLEKLKQHSEKKLQSEKLEIIAKTPREPVKLQVASKPNKKHEADKENRSKSNAANPENKSKTITDLKVQKSRSNTPTIRPNKRCQSSSRSMTQNREKIPKKTNTSLKTTSEKLTDKSDLISLNMSPICKVKSSSTSQVSHRNKSCPEQVKKSSSDGNLQRKIQDDEETLIIDITDGPKSHKDAINLSKAFQQIMPKRCNKSDLTLKDDLTQSPMVSQIKLVFDEENEDHLKKNQTKEGRTEPEKDILNNSTDNLVNNLYKDIMEAKMRQQNSTTFSSCSKGLSDSGIFSKYMLRQILEKC